jgi:hypothetical protein
MFVKDVNDLLGKSFAKFPPGKKGRKRRRRRRKEGGGGGGALSF